MTPWLASSTLHREHHFPIQIEKEFKLEAATMEYGKFEDCLFKRESSLKYEAK